MSVIVGMDLNGLPAHLARMPAGTKVSLAVAVEGVMSQEVLEQVASAAEDSGLQLLAPVTFASMDWEGYRKSAIYLSFVNPEVPQAGEYSFWPAVILALGAAGALGYFMWKGGEVTESSVSTLLKMVFPLALLASGVYLISSYSKRAG